MSDPWRLRAIAEEELETFWHSMSIAFGEEDDADEKAGERKLAEFDRSLAAFDDGRIVGTAGVFTLGLTVPGGRSVRTPGVTWVSVLPTHRRRGILTHMMRHQLRDIRERGESFAALWASESLIYGRFGYGIASWRRRLELQRTHARLLSPPPAGGVQLVTRDEALAACAPLFNAVVPSRPGMLARDDRWWRHVTRDDPSARNNRGPLMFALHHEGAALIGYVTYRIRPNWEAHPEHVVDVREMIATTPAAHRALWGYITGIDLSVTSRWANAPLDDPLHLMLHDPRRLSARIEDALHLRMVDVAAALGARRYSREGRVVLRVHDEFMPDWGGTWQLDAGPDGASVRDSASAPDVELDVRALGAAYLGSTSMRELALAGRVTGAPAAIQNASAMFTWPVPAWCDRVF